jgi:Cytochrome P450
MTATAEATGATKGRAIPGPRGHPILGSIREIQRDNIQAFMDAWRGYGDIVHFRGPLTVNLLVHPDYVQRVLLDNYPNYPRPTFGHGRRHRPRLDPAAGARRERTGVDRRAGPRRGDRLLHRRPRDGLVGVVLDVDAAPQNPESWRRLRAEVDGVLGGRTPTAEDVPKLDYTTRVLLESMRLYPPIFVLMRCATEDDEVGGYHVPAGSNIVLCPHVTHRHPEFWENPEGFDPDRFTPERSQGLRRMAYFPFSGGPRKCIGNSFAMIQMPIVLAMATQRFRLDLRPGEQVVPEPAISLRPRDPLLMTVERVGEVAA